MVDKSEVSKQSFSIYGEGNVPQILSDLNEQRQSERFCDVVLRVAEQKIYAHSNILAAASPYFGSFLGKGQDLPRAFSQKTPQIIEIHIDDNKYGWYGVAVSKIVTFMYTGYIEFDQQIYSPLVEIAKIMEMKTIIELCTGSEFSDACQVLPVMATTDHVKQEPEPTDKEAHVEQRISEGRDSPNPKKNPVMRKEGRSGRNEDFNSFEETTIESPVNEPATSTRDSRSDEDDFPFCFVVSKDSASDFDGDPDFDDSSARSIRENNKTSYINRRPVRKTKSRYKSNLKLSGKQKLTSNLAKKKTLKKVTNKLREELKEYFFDCSYVCPKCDYKSGNILNFKRHLTSHSEGKYSCDMCSYRTAKLKDLKMHKKKHMEDNRVCKFCNFECNSEEEFKKHMKSHNTPYKCTDCDAKFRTKSALALHTPKHSEVKPFVCYICSASFKWKHALKNHLVVHNITKEHLCDVCGFSTAHKSQLKSHRLIHTGETFKCEVPGCDFQATKRQSLKYHMLSHTQEKPHQCDICGRAFSLSKNMKRHMLLHTQVHPYKCDLCYFTSTRQDKLREHLLKSHNVGKAGGRKFRISDYNKVDVDEEGHQECLVEPMDTTCISIDNTKTDETVGVVMENDSRMQLYAQTPDGQTFPITLSNSDMSQALQISDIQDLQYIKVI